MSDKTIVADTPDAISFFCCASAFGIAKLDLKGIKMRNTTNAWRKLAHAAGFQHPPRSRKQKAELYHAIGENFPNMYDPGLIVK